MSDFHGKPPWFDPAEAGRVPNYPNTHPPPPVAPVQKDPPGRLPTRLPGGGTADEYDPLLKLRRTEKALTAAGSRGEAVAEQLQEVRNSIRAMIESRERQNARGMER